MIRQTFALASVAALCACGGGRSVLPPSKDGPPIGPPPVDLAAVAEPVPRSEPLSRRGNPDSYEVMGRQYRVMASADGFTQRGLASWYGRKFHGRSTSSGEPYDMYKMTAAHKRLPLPSYVRVTNLDNGREVVVRVNDRGPFHPDRIIDLSYAAAVRLGMLGNGTAPVEIQVLAAGGAAVHDPSGPDLYLQTGAFSERENADRLARRLESMGVAQVFVVSPRDGGEPFHRVRVGPFDDTAALSAARRRLAEAGFDAHTLRD